jgi:hypothetical protein
VNYVTCKQVCPEDRWWLSLRCPERNLRCCTRRYGHAGKHMSSDREWEHGAKFSLPRERRERSAESEDV